MFPKHTEGMSYTHWLVTGMYQSIIRETKAPLPLVTKNYNFGNQHHCRHCWGGLETGGKIPNLMLAWLNCHTDAFVHLQRNWVEENNARFQANEGPKRHVCTSLPGTLIPWIWEYTEICITQSREEFPAYLTLGVLITFPPCNLHRWYPASNEKWSVPEMCEPYNPA